MMEMIVSKSNQGHDINLKLENENKQQVILLQFEEKNDNGLYLLMRLKYHYLLLGDSLDELFIDDSLSLLDFQRHITVAYWDFLFQRNHL